MQLTLSLFGHARLRPAVEDYMANQCDSLAEATIQDYRERAAWCYHVFGEYTPLEQITYPAIYKAIQVWGPRGRGLREITLRKRLTFLRAVLRHAYGMGHLVTSPPELPRLRDDGDRNKTVLSRTQFAAFRMALPPGPHRKLADLAYWTGMHNLDLFSMRRDHLDLAYVWEGTNRVGAFWRRNHKNQNHANRLPDTWFPLEPGAMPAMREILDDARPGPDALLVGRVWNISRTFHKACDRAEVPRVSPLRLRASLSSRFTADGETPEMARLALAQIGEFDPRTGRPRSTTTSRHYMGFTPDHVRSRTPM